MRVAVASLALILVPLLAHAEVYDDGGSHVLDHTTAEMVEVDNATRFELVTGGEIAPATDSNGLQALGGSTLILSGGSIEAGAGESPRIGLASWGCDVAIADGVVIRGGLSSGSTGGKGAHVDAPSPYLCRIDGGQLLGRDNPTHGGPGATLAGNLEIRGGRFQGGDGTWSSGGIGLWILRGSGVIETAEVYGGTGYINGGPALIVSEGDLTIENGYFVGGDGHQSGGTALKTAGGSRVVVHGGNFIPGAAPAPNGWALTVIEHSVLELHGGRVETRVVVMHDAELIVFGAGFSGDGSTAIDGTLEDGTPISVVVATFGNGRVTLVETVATESSTFGEIKARY